MDDVETRVSQLERQATELRIRTLEANRALVDEFTALWNEMNALAVDRPEVRALCDGVAADIARIEKLDIALDTEWLAESKREHTAGDPDPL